MTLLVSYESGQLMMPRTAALTTAAVLLVAPSLLTAFFTWNLTVGILGKTHEGSQRCGTPGLGPAADGGVVFVHKRVALVVAGMKQPEHGKEGACAPLGRSLVHVTPDETAEQLQTVFGQDAFRVKLHPLHRQEAMTHAHHITIIRGPRSDLQAIG